MSPRELIAAKKQPPSDNLYTIIIALALLAALFTVTLVAYKCYFDYGTIFTIP